MGKKKKPIKKPAAPTPKKEQYPHFRRYKVSNHPALILGEQKDEKEREEYVFRKVTSSPKEGRHNNEKVEPNPDTSKSTPMYIVRRKRHDLKTRFGKKYPWKYPKDKE